MSTVWADRNDRLARDLFEARAFFATCSRTGTAWQFFSEPWLDSDAPGAEELRQRAAFDAEMESRRIGTRLRRHYQHAMAAGTPIARRAPLGFRIEGRGDQRQYVLDDRPVAGEVTMAGAARLLIDKYLEAGTIWSGLRRWKEALKTLEPIHDPDLLGKCLRLTVEGTGGWLEGAAAELQGHVAKAKNERITGDDGSVSYRRLPWNEWELSRDRHERLIDATTARRVLAQLEENRNKGRAAARGREAANPDALPSFTPVAFCGACGRRLRQQSTRAGRRPEDPPYRTLRCAGAKTANPQCDQRGLSETMLCRTLAPQLVEVAGQQALSAQATPGTTPEATIDPALLQQIERTRELAAQTGLPELRQALLALEDRAAAQAAAAAEASQIELNRRLAGLYLNGLLPNLRKDVEKALLTDPAARRELLRFIERIEVRDGKVVGVQLKG